jgi:hypothetical protein
MEEDAMIYDRSFKNSSLLYRMSRLESSQNVNLNILANVGSNGPFGTGWRHFQKRDSP